MARPALPANEDERLAALQSYDILDSDPEEAFDDLVAIAAGICKVPMAVVSLIDRDRQWFKAKLGVDADETSRDVAFCAHAIHDPDHVMVVPDAREDDRFRDNPMVTGDPNVRFYAGAPLKSSEGHALGTLCVIDDQPRDLDPAQLAALEALSRQASRVLELRRAAKALKLQLEERGWYEQQLLHYQTELESQNADLTEQSMTDPLTGLANRRAFAASLERAIDKARQEGSALAIAVVDIDHFKSINDIHGHAEGDHVLQALGAMLKSSEAARGRIARYGGEEFVLLLPGLDPQAAVAECEYLREAVAAMPSGLPITVSIGVASLQDGEDASVLFARADKALYAAKQDGRDRVRAA